MCCLSVSIIGSVSVMQHLLGRAPIIAMWADRFSWYCLRRFSRFLACPLTLPQYLPVVIYHLCSTPLVLLSRRRGKGEGVGDIELTMVTLSGSDCNNLT